FVNDQSNPTVTAYALLGLAVAREEGYPISRDVITRAQMFLSSNLVVPTRGTSEYLLNRQAFMLYTLARSGQINVSNTVVLYDYRNSMQLYAKAFLAQTFA